MFTQSFPQLLRWALASFSLVIGVMWLLALGLVGGYALGLTLAVAAAMMAVVGVIGVGAVGASWTAIRVTQAMRARWPVRRRARTPAGRAPREAPVSGSGMSLNEKAEALGRADILLGLPSVELEHVAKYAQERHAEADTMLAVERQPGEDIYFILHGRVQLFTRSGVGEITVRVAGPGESLPLAALLDSGVHVTSARAMTDVVALSVKREDLLRLCAGRPALGAHVYRAAATVMARRYNETLQRMTTSLEYALQGKVLTPGGLVLGEPSGPIRATPHVETSTPSSANWPD